MKGVAMNNIQVARETLKTIENQSYLYGGTKVSFADKDFRSVVVITPEEGKELLGQELSDFKNDGMCSFEVVNSDSFQAARRFQNPFVMNFANAHNPGGGFLLGATAQEEALCRCSTLYASISSKEASKMYLFNNTHISSMESDYMLLSPNVIVFRNEKCELLEKPFQTAVITIPAPNRHGAALFTSGKRIQETMQRRMRIMLRVAKRGGYRNLILGAWGCGEFGNDPRDIAAYFKEIFVTEGYGKCFETVCFAIYGKEDGRNINAFREVFQDM